MSAPAQAPASRSAAPSSAGLSFMRALCWVAVSDGPLNAAETAALARVSESNDALRGCLADALERIEEIDRSSIADACRFVADLSLTDRHDLLPCAVQLAVADGTPNATEVRTLKLLADMCCAGVGAWQTLSDTYEAVTGSALPEDDAPWSVPVETLPADPAGDAQAAPVPHETAPPIPADAVRLAIETLYAAGQTDSVLPVLRHMARSRQRLAEANAPAQLLLDLAADRCATGRADEAIAALGHALTLAGELAFDAGLHTRALALLPELMRVGRHADALRHTEAALEMARRGGDRAGTARTLALQATLLNLLGEHQRALDAAVESIEDGCRGPFPEGWSPLDVGSEAERALAAMDRAGEIAELWESISSLSAQAGRSSEHAEATARAALAMMELQRLDRATPLLESALAAIAETGPVSSGSVTDLQLRLAGCHRALGHLDKALQADRLAEASLRHEGNLPELARCLLRIAEDLQALGDATGAEASAGEAARIAEHARERLPAAKANRMLGQLLQHAGRHAEALDAFGTALRIAREPEPVAGWKPDETILGMCRSLAATDDALGAAELMRTLAQEARDDGDLRRAESLHAECAGMLERAGHLQGATTFYASAEECGRLAGSGHPLNAWRLAQATCLARLDRLDEALQCLLDSLAQPHEPGGLLGDLLHGSAACRALQGAEPLLASRFATHLFAQVKAATGAADSDPPSLALGLAALLARAHASLHAADGPMTDEAMLRNLLKALELLDRAQRKGRLPASVPAADLRGIVSEAWAWAAELLERSGDRMSAAGARESATQWKRAV